jgi:hypothetical protein
MLHPPFEKRYMVARGDGGGHGVPRATKDAKRLKHPHPRIGPHNVKIVTAMTDDANRVAIIW